MLTKLGIKLFLVFISLILNIQLFSQSIQTDYFSLQDKKIILRHNWLLNTFADSSSRNTFFLLGETKNKDVPSVRMDSLITFDNGSFGLKNIFKYNGNGKISKSILLADYGSGWENDLKDIYSYNNNDKLASDLGLGWYENKWDSLDYSYYDYSSDGNLLRYVLQVDNNNAWNDFAKTSNDFDDNGHLISSTYENWKYDKWWNSFLSTNFYSAKNKKDSILFQTWDTNNWQNFRKSLFYYSDETQTQLDSIVGKYWNGTAWENLIKRVYVFYDIYNNPLEVIDKLWNNGTWGNASKYVYTYNEYNLLKTAECKVWSQEQWAPGIGVLKVEYGDFSVAFYTEGFTVYYSVITGVKDNEVSTIKSFKLFQNYPNPFNPSTKIEYSIPSAATRQTLSVKLKIYDVFGRTIAVLVNKKQSAGNYQVSFSADNLPSGVYIYRLQVGKFSKARKMILLR